MTEDTRDPQYAEAWALVDEMRRAVDQLHAWPAADLDEPVAAMLELTIAEAEHHIPAWTRPSQGVDDPGADSAGQPERLVTLVWHHFGTQIATARKVLARAESVTGRTR